MLKQKTLKGSFSLCGKGMTEMAKYQLSGDYATKAEAQGYADAKDDAIAAAKKAGDDA